MLPVEFCDMMRLQLGSEDSEQLFAAIEEQPPISIRLNNKVETLTFDADIDEVPWHEDGYYLSSRPQFTLDPLFHAGCYYVQEASSMFLQQVLEQWVSRDSIVLDMCAAPGGKSTLISQYLGEEGLLVSNEIIRQRVFILSENVQKWGNGNTVVTHNPASDFGEKTPNLFDCILVDAPCSGEGMFRKEPDALKDWSRHAVRTCVDRQRSILTDVWEALKPGGIMIYSTCTFNHYEDEENARWIAEQLGADLLQVKYDTAWGITETHAGYHFYPHKMQGEGFYICALRKYKRNVNLFHIRQDKKKNATEKVEMESSVHAWLQEPEKWAIRQADRFLTAYPIKYKDIVDYLGSQFLCVCTGFGLGEFRGKGLTPQHSLSMAKAMNKDAFPHVELTLEHALCYLRTEALALSGLPLGYILVTYQHVPLGFVKNVGNRSNNLYPYEWRIRKL